MIDLSVYSMPNLYSQSFRPHLIEHVHSFGPTTTQRESHGGCLNVPVSASRSPNWISVHFENDMFEKNANRRDYCEEEGETQQGDDRLVPEPWRSLQVGLYRSRRQRKEEMQLQQMDNMLKRAAELELKRQKLKVTSTAVRNSTAEQSSLSTHEAVLDNHLKEHKVTGSELISPPQAGENGRRQLDCQKRIDSELDCLFGEVQVANLKRATPDFATLHCDKWPMLHVLVASGQFFLLNELLKTNVDVNAVDEDGYTAVHKAVLGRKETAVSQLLRAGAEVNVFDKDGASFLHYSAQIGSLNLVRLFVKYQVDINHADENGWTALHVAVATGRDDIVRHLLVSGADKHCKTKDGKTPFDICLALGRSYRTYAVAKTLKRLPKEGIPAAHAQLEDVEALQGEEEMEAEESLLTGTA